LLFGVDAVSGSPLWAYYSGDAPVRSGQLRSVASVSYGQLGFCGAPQVSRGRVVEMPRHSRYIHCVDLASGKRLWKVPRFSPEPTGRPGNGDEYVAAIVGDVVLVVGMQVCRGLSLENGDVRWSVAFGAPSGRGVLVDDKYLLPLEEGRIATISVETGEQIGFSIPRRADGDEANPSFWRPGNLVAHGEMIVSTGPYGVSAFPQSEPLLARARQMLKGRPDSAPDLLLAAELELNLGGLDRAYTLLERCMSFPLKQAQRVQAETLFRELLYLKLEENPHDAQAVLARLENFSHSPEHRARFLMARAEWQLRSRSFQGVLDSVHELARLNPQGLLPDSRDPSLRVSARSWAAGIHERMRKAADDQQRRRIDDAVLTRQQDALDAGTIAAMQSFLVEFANWPHAAPVRQRLAETLIEAARFQQAELLLLQNRGDADPAIAAEATATLARLWDDRRLFGEAGQLLDEMDGRFADTQLSDGTTGREFVESFPKDSITWQARHTAAETEAPARVSIIQRHWEQTNVEMESAYRQTRGYFSWPDRSDLSLVNKGTSRETVLAAVDRQTGLIVGECKIPRRMSYPVWARHTRLGHMLPLGGTAAMHGVSLLQMVDEEPLWSVRFEPLEAREDRMLVGPAGPGVCVFQGRGYLVGVDPATGRILWQRSELPPDCGLFVNQSIGLIGDDEAIAVFNADRASYSVYRTATGEFVRSGRLSIDVRYLSQSRAFGRRLVYVSSVPGNRRLQVVDILSGRIEYDLPFTSQLMTTVTPDNELVVVLPDGTLRILDVEKGVFSLQWRFDPHLLVGRSTSNVVVFSDERNYYVNIQKRPYRRINRQPRYHSYYTTTHFPRSTVQADLFAISRETGKVQWRRNLSQRTVLRAPQYGLPYMILLSYVRDLRQGNRNSVLVEVIDRRSGATIGLREGLLPDRFVELSVDPTKRHVQLHGFNSRIDIDAQAEPPFDPESPSPMVPGTLGPSASR
jgi:outer membrane protein assembly factor BamB